MVELIDENKGKEIWPPSALLYLNKNYKDFLKDIGLEYSLVLKPSGNFEAYLNRLDDICLEPLENIFEKKTYEKIRVKCHGCGIEDSFRINKINSKNGCTACIKEEFKAKLKLSLEDLLVHYRRNNFKLLSNYSEFENLRSILKAECLKCGFVSDYVANSVKGKVRCRNCRSN